MIYGLTTVPTPNWFPPSSNLGYWNCILSHSRSGRLSLGAFARYSQFDVCALRKIEVGYIGRRHAQTQRTFVFRFHSFMSTTAAEAEAAAAG